MELINKTVMSLKWDSLSTKASDFKQDPKLALAINKLSVAQNYEKRSVKTAGKHSHITPCSLSLPGRKLEFGEVRQFLSQSTAETMDKPYRMLLIDRLNSKKALIKKIEDILENINENAEGGTTPKLIIRNQRLWSNCIYDLDRVTLKAFALAKKTTVTYNEDKSRFSTIVFVLTKAHELLIKNLTLTRRELFYQNVTRFRNQSHLDIAVRDVCCLLETPPWDLGIVATAKGLVAGCLSFKTSDGAFVDCMTSGGTLVPQDINGMKELKSSAKYILVVEKDAIFQKLLDEGALIRLGPLIIITGKGYPDVCTRQLLCRLCKELRLQALALVDADPHGYEIFFTYKYGSLAQSHLSSSLVCSSLQLLGVRYLDVMILAPNESRMKLTERDKRKINALMKRPYLDTSTGSVIKEELHKLLNCGMKTELEAMAPTAAALCDAYLPAKIIQGNHLG